MLNNKFNNQFFNLCLIFFICTAMLSFTVEHPNLANEGKTINIETDSFPSKTLSKFSKSLFFNKLDTLLSFHNYFNPVEKVYLHTDKNHVDVGDELWYSAYTVIGPNHHYSSASKFLHVNIVDLENDIVFSQRVKIVNGKSKGHIKIPENTLSGKYQLRAYTDWMRNYDLNFVFKKTISISNGTINPIHVNYGKIDLQFFPEGGNAIDGLNGRIAFKAIGIDGLARIIEGMVIDSKGNEIKQLKSNDQGIGYFNLKPVLGEQYTAVLEDGSKHLLPKIYNQGYTMSVNNMNQKSIQVRIQASNNLKNESFYLIGTVGNQKYFQGKYNLKDKSFANIEIPKNVVPSGILTLTILDKNMRPWSERVTFIDNQQELIINTQLNKDNLIKKGEVTLKINVTNTEGNPVSTNLSIAVTNQSNRIKKDVNDSNILTHLLLESDVKGHIEKPAKYFHDKSRIAKYNLDLIMLTNGWRRFNWMKMKNYNFDTIKKFSFPEGFDIAGIAKRKNRKILKNSSLHLIVKSKDKERVYATKTRPDGSFIFNNVNHTGVTEIQFKAYNSNQIDVKVTLDNTNPIDLAPLFPSLYKINPTSSNTTSTTTKPSIISNRNSKGKTTLLNEVVIKGKVNVAKSERKKATPSTYGVTPDATIFIDENFTYSNLKFALLKIPGVTVLGDRILIRGVGSLNGNTSPAIYVDGIQSNISLFNLNVLDIERVEVVKRVDAVFGFRGANGVILVYTKRGFKPKPAITPKFKISGFAEEKQFYTPKYEVDVNKNDNATLYWNPLITTDKNGNATVNFHNMSNAKKVQVAIEALSYFGEPGAYLKTFN